MKFKQRPREEQAEADETEEAGAAAEMYGVDTEVGIWGSNMYIHSLSLT